MDLMRGFGVMPSIFGARRSLQALTASFALALVSFGCNESNTVTVEDADSGEPEEELLDAGNIPVPDAGPVTQDAGSGEDDAGAVTEDAGAPEEDAGPGFQDAGTGDQDAGVDAGTHPVGDLLCDPSGVPVHATVDNPDADGEPCVWTTCDAGYHRESAGGSDTCQADSKLVQCDASSIPVNSEAVDEDVYISWTGSAWETVPPCQWQCKERYYRDGDSCVAATITKECHPTGETIPEHAHIANPTVGVAEGAEPEDCRWTCDEGYHEETIGATSLCIDNGKQAFSCINTVPEHGVRAQDYYYAYYNAATGEYEDTSGKDCAWTCVLPYRVKDTNGVKTCELPQLITYPFAIPVDDDACPNGGIRYAKGMDNDFDGILSTEIIEGKDSDQIIETTDECYLAPEYVSVPTGAISLRHDTYEQPKGAYFSTESFRMSKTLVTVAQYEACVAAGACTSFHTNSNGSQCNMGRDGLYGNQPMNCADYTGAQQYCAWIGGRLPTEFEWEYAATHDGKTCLKTTYPWGDASPSHCSSATYNASGYCTSTTGSGLYSTEVGANSPAGDSPLGLQDMAGNLWEWTTSQYQSGKDWRTLKGGSWSSSSGQMAVSTRGYAGPASFNGDIGIRCVIDDYVSIPYGSYKLSHDTQYHSSGETVAVNAFKMGRRPVSVAEYQACVKAGGCSSDNHMASDILETCNMGRGDAWNDHPVNCVMWNGAAEYCAWIGGRLPTEEEWEYAATHDGTTSLGTTFPWGSDTAGQCVHANFKSGDSYCDGSKKTSVKVGTSAIGTYSPKGDSPLGLVDMLGNAWEWVSTTDWSGSDDPVLKGGAWDASFDDLNIVRRRPYDPATYQKAGGFRCVKDEEFATIPSGSYVNTYAAHPLYSPGDEIVMSKAYQISKRPVSVADYERCVEAGACTRMTSSITGSAREYEVYSATSYTECNYGRGEKWRGHPMNCVFNNSNKYPTAAEKYCKWIGGRLPTDSEWEYAASHDSDQYLTTKYVWGDAAPKHCVTANYMDSSDSMGAYCDGKRHSSTTVGTAPIGLYSPANSSPLGLIDMTGNLMEWTTSLNYQTSDTIRMVMGTDYRNSYGPDSLAANFRYPSGAQETYNIAFIFRIGFRCVKDLANDDVPIPAGSYKLSHATDFHQSGETVGIPAFRMDRTPVTVGKFMECVNAGACSKDSYNTVDDEDTCNVGRGDTWTRSHPMNCVNLKGAQDYCAWTGGRLPTEEEWEYAATHDGTKSRGTMYPWGDKAPQHCRTANYKNGSFCSALAETSTQEGTSAVGTYSPDGDSPLGISDLSGNVYEYVAIKAGASKGALKGGSWSHDYGAMQVTGRRANSDASEKASNRGFRCVR